MYHPTTRLLAVLELLQSRGRVGGAELARRLEVDERTVRRYITMLRELGIPVEGELGRYGDLSAPAGLQAPAADVHRRGVAGRRARAARGPADGPDAGGHRHRGAPWRRSSGCCPAPLREPRPGRVRRADARPADGAPRTPASEVVMTVSVAARERRTVWMRYRSGRTTAETERLFDPYGVVYRAGRWYTAGHCHLRDDPGCSAWTASLRARSARSRSCDRLASTAWPTSSSQSRRCPAESDLEVVFRTTLDVAREIMLPGRRHPGRDRGRRPPEWPHPGRRLDGSLPVESALADGRASSRPS